MIAPNNAPPQTIGARLRVARVSAGLTMGQLASMTGDAVPVISSEENDLREVPPARLAMLASYYGVSVDWLVTGALRHVEIPDGLPPDEHARLTELLGRLGSPP